MAQVISISNQKGGVGKTTSAVNLAASLAAAGHRTLLVDIRPMAEVMQTTGVPIEACVFIGSSPIRQYAEEWEVADILRHTREAVEFAVREGLDVMYVTEDTVRSSPEHLRVLFSAAVDAKAKRLCLCDTVGAAIPEGVMNLVSWVQKLLDELGVGTTVGIDWHGHRDRGLGLANTLAAIRAGAYDFITKPFELQALELTLTRALQHRELRAEVRRLRQVVQSARSFDELIGASPAMRATAVPLSSISTVAAGGPPDRNRTIRSFQPASASAGCAATGGPAAAASRSRMPKISAPRGLIVHAV